MDFDSDLEAVFEDAWDATNEYKDSHCPACGEPIDYCLGHGVIGDPEGARVLHLHDEDIHTLCNPRGCKEAANRD